MSGRSSPSKKAVLEGRPPLKEQPHELSSSEYSSEEGSTSSHSDASQKAKPQKKGYKRTQASTGASKTPLPASPPAGGAPPPAAVVAATIKDVMEAQPSKRDSLSPKALHDRDLSFAAHLIKADAFSPGLMATIKSYLNKKERTRSAPTTSGGESSAMDTADPIATGVRRKREDDTSPPTTKGEVKRPRAVAPHAWESLPQRAKTYAATAARPSDIARLADAARPAEPARLTSPCNKDVGGKALYARTSASTSAAVDTARPSTPPAQPAPPKAPTKKFPPLVVELLPNWATHLKALKQRLGHTPNARPFGKGVRFSPTSVEEYRAVQAYLTALEKTENLAWFSYSLPEERSHKVAIRGLPADTPPEEIAEELRSLGFEPEAIRAIRASKGRPGCIFFGQFKNTPNLLPSIYNITELLCMPGVKVDAWRGKKGPAQCHRCQGFRHSSHNCHRPLACVRCGGPHFAGECPRDKESPATCANCGGPHAANSTSCQVFKKEARNKKAGAIASTTPNTAARGRSGTRPPPPATSTTAEAAANNLMAPANLPTERTARIPKKRKPKRRVVVLDPLPTTDQSDYQTTSVERAPTALPASARRPVPRNTKPAARPSRSRSAAPLPAGTAPPPATRPQHIPPRARGPTMDSARLQVLDTALVILQEVLQALRLGEDPIPLVLSGIGKLFQLH